MYFLCRSWAAIRGLNLEGGPRSFNRLSAFIPGMTLLELVVLERKTGQGTATLSPNIYLLIHRCRRRAWQLRFLPGFGFRSTTGLQIFLGTGLRFRDIFTGVFGEREFLRRAMMQRDRYEFNQETYRGDETGNDIIGWFAGLGLVGFLSSTGPVFFGLRDSFCGLRFNNFGHGNELVHR